jgi:hypothetical protein
MTVVDPPGEYYGRSYYAVYFTEETAGGKEISRRRFTAHSLELHSPLLITGRKQWIWAGDHFLHLQVGASPRALMLSNHYVVTAEDLQEVPRATTVLTKMRSLRAQATRASVCGFPATRRRL